MEINKENLLKLKEKVVNILGEGGVVSRSLENYELRPQQLKMAEAICESIEIGKHLIVEAGTGIGKSLAYLVPFIIYATETNRKVIISTNTKALQQQLYQKDLPFLKKSLGIEFYYALCLGSENYLCIRRLKSEFTYDLFDSNMQLNDAKRIIEWYSKTRSGIKSELDFIPIDEVWDRVSREPDLCLGNKCINKNVLDQPLFMWFNDTVVSKKTRHGFLI